MDEPTVELRPDRPFVIGVAGGSSSGKTTVAERLAEMAGDRHVSLVKLDSYYVDLSDADLATRTGFDFDHPDAFDWPLLNDHWRRSRPERRSPCRSTTTC